MGQDVTNSEKLMGYGFILLIIATLSFVSYQWITSNSKQTSYTPMCRNHMKKMVAFLDSNIDVLSKEEWEKAGYQRGLGRPFDPSDPVTNKDGFEFSIDLF